MDLMWPFKAKELSQGERIKLAAEDAVKAFRKHKLSRAEAGAALNAMVESFKAAGVFTEGSK